MDVQLNNHSADNHGSDEQAKIGGGGPSSVFIDPVTRLVSEVGGPGLMTAPADSVPQELRERFVVSAAFASGETGTLYVAEEAMTGRPGLLKILRGSVLANGPERQRLKRELAKQATLAHDTLVLPLVTGETASVLWLFRDGVNGVSLRKRLADDGPLPIDQALRIAADIATALDELHRAGLLHRDLKPEHVIVSPDRPVQVIDAGVAAPIPNEAVFDLVGTAAYVSPEQAAGKLVSFRSDLYALGCVLWEMITGRPPFEADSIDALLGMHRDQPTPSLPGSVPEVVSSLLGSLLAKDPRERPFSAQQVRRAIDAVSAGEPADAALTPISATNGHGATTAIELGMVKPPLPPEMNGPRMEAEQLARPPIPPSANPQSAPVPSVSQHALPVAVSPAPAPRASVPPPVPRASAAPPPAAPTRSVPPPPPVASHGATTEASAMEVPVVVAPAMVAGPPASKPSVDGTQELTALDIVDEGSGPLGMPQADPRTTQIGGFHQPVAMTAERAVTHAPHAHLAASPSAPSAVAIASAPQAWPAMTEAAASELSHADYDPFAEPFLPGGVESAGQDPGSRSAATASEAGHRQAGHARPSPTPYYSEAPSSPGAHWDPAGAPPDPNAAQARPVASAPSSNGFHAAEAAVAPSSIAPTAVPTAAPAARKSGAPAIIVAVVASIFFTLLVVGGGLYFYAASEGNDLASLMGASAQPSPTGEVAPTGTATPGAIRAAAARPSAAPNPAALPSAVPDGRGEESATEPQDSNAGVAAVAETGTDTAPETTPIASATSEAARPARVERAVQRRDRRNQRAGNIQRANEVARAEAEAAPPEAPPAGDALTVLRNQARTHFRARRFGEASAAYERAVTLAPSDAGLFAGLGASRLASGDARGAVAAYQRAVQLKPNHSGFFAALGRAFKTLGDSKSARAAYQRALTLNPNNGAARAALQAP